MCTGRKRASNGGVTLKKYMYEEEEGRRKHIVSECTVTHHRSFTDPTTPPREGPEAFQKHFLTKTRKPDVLITLLSESDTQQKQNNNKRRHKKKHRICDATCIYKGGERDRIIIVVIIIIILLPRVLMETICCLFFLRGCYSSHLVIFLFFVFSLINMINGLGAPSIPLLIHRK